MTVLSLSTRSAIAMEESFDSADMEEEDPHEGVGVDERAASLDPQDFVGFSSPPADFPSTRPHPGPGPCEPNSLAFVNRPDGMHPGL